MKKRRKANKFVVAYLLCVIIAISQYLATYISVFFDKQLGGLNAELLSIEEFQLKDLEIVDLTTLRSLSDDPWMILPVEDLDIYTLEVTCTYSKSPYEICMYYSTSENQSFSADYRVWPVEIYTNTYLFILPRKHLHSLRLDICSTCDNKITFGKIEINNRDSFNRAFSLNGWKFFSILFIPLYFISVVLAFVKLGEYIVQKCPIHSDYTNQQ